jgi:hypothetical protein
VSSARATLLFACTQTSWPAFASATLIACPNAPLPPVTSALFRAFVMIPMCA